MLALLGPMVMSAPVRLEAVTLSSILQDVGTVLTSMFGWLSNVFTAITDNPVLFLLVMGSFGLICIGIVRRLLKL